MDETRAFWLKPVAQQEHWWSPSQGHSQRSRCGDAPVKSSSSWYIWYVTHRGQKCVAHKSQQSEPYKCNKLDCKMLHLLFVNELPLALRISSLGDSAYSHFAETSLQRMPFHRIPLRRMPECHYAE